MFSLIELVRRCNILSHKESLVWDSLANITELFLDLYIRLLIYLDISMEGNHCKYVSDIFTVFAQNKKVG